MLQFRLRNLSAAIAFLCIALATWQQWRLRHWIVEFAAHEGRWPKAEPGVPMIVAWLFAVASVLSLLGHWLPAAFFAWMATGVAAFSLLFANGWI
jgi:hypothetical protein